MADVVLPKNCLLTVDPSGDSITFGAGSDPGDITKGTGYRWPLQEGLKRLGINIAFVGAQSGGHDADVPQIYHNGTSGDTIASVQARIISRAGQCSEVMLVMVGANDIMQDRSGSDMASDLNTLLGIAWDINQRTKSSLNRTKLIAVSQIPDVYFQGVNAASRHQEAINYNALIPGICASHRANGRNMVPVNHYAMLGPAPGKNFNQNSQPHPNATGYLLIRDGWIGTPGSGLLIDYAR